MSAETLNASIIGDIITEALSEHLIDVADFYMHVEDDEIVISVTDQYSDRKNFLITINELNKL